MNKLLISLILSLICTTYTAHASPQPTPAGQGSEGGDPSGISDYKDSIEQLEYEMAYQKNLKVEANFYQKLFKHGDIARRLGSFLENFDLNNIVHPEVRKSLLAINKEELLKDIYSQNYVFKAEDQCLDKNGTPYTMVTQLAANSHQPLIGEPICIDTLRLAKNQTGEGVIGQLVGLLLHEHVRHFGIDDDLIDENQKLVHPIGAMVSYHYNKDFFQLSRHNFNPNYSGKFGSNYRLNLEISPKVGVRLSDVDESCKSSHYLAKKSPHEILGFKRKSKLKMNEIIYFNIKRQRYASLLSFEHKSRKCAFKVEVFNRYGTKVGSRTISPQDKYTSDSMSPHRKFQTSIVFTTDDTPAEYFYLSTPFGGFYKNIEWK